MYLASPHLVDHAPINPKTLYSAIGSAQSVKLGLASNPESSSAWVKTVIDPAHAREYSCRGIPDENQDPTLVYYGRDTLTLTPGWLSTGNIFQFTGSGWARTSAAKDIVWNSVYIVQTGLVSRNVIIVAIGDGVVNDVNQVLMARSDVTDATGASPGDTVRLVSQSLTVSWAGKELDRGGIFEAGYVPYVDVQTGSQDQVSVSLDDFSNYATFTSSSDDGVYMIGRFNQYDMYKWWKNVGKLAVSVKSNGGTCAGNEVTEFIAPTAYGAWRPSVVRYVTNAQQDWILRVTYNTVVEVMRPYNQGGTDSAVYDMDSVQDVIAIYDSLDLIFPARYNDFKKVWNWIKSNAPAAVSLTASVLRHFPSAAGVANALNMLVGQAPISFAGGTKSTNKAPSKKSRITGKSLKQLQRHM